MPSVRQHNDLHTAAAAGDLALVQDILAYADSPPQPNAPDDEGRSAIFYSQIRGHSDVTAFLVQHGWTAMPEGNLYAGPGGRSMFWQSGAWGSARPTSMTRNTHAPPVSCPRGDTTAKKIMSKQRTLGPTTIR